MWCCHAMFKVVTLFAITMADGLGRLTECLAALCEVENGEALYLFLEQNTMLDSSWRPKRIFSKLALPLLGNQNPDQILEIIDTNLGFVVEIQKVAFEKAELSNNPHEKLQRIVTNYLETSVNEVLKKQLIADTPSKWERLGDLIILQEKAFSSTEWKSFFGEKDVNRKMNFWRDIALALGGKRLARQHHVASDKLRSSQTELLYGDSGWVEFLDHGVLFGFDATKVMFSSGNITERRRIGSIQMGGEVIVDAYAGMGYYTLHMAKRSQAKVIHACELNPNSIKGLKWARDANALGEKIVIHEGDNDETLPKLYGVANRCHLGLLPSSEPVWEHAIQCLKPDGGWLHIHMNVQESELNSWRENTLEKLRYFAQQYNRNWNIESRHLELVKWFSPHVRHVVLDVQCSAK